MSSLETSHAIPASLAGKLEVRETNCATILHKLNYRRSCEYTANFYSGCSHGCVYCYAPSLIHDEREWGTFVDVKVNADKVLDRELRDAQKQVVFLSSASDPYQPVEARYRITRRCLQVLINHDFPVIILTRSPLVLRDIDLLKRLKWVRVGFSITTVPNTRFEPGVPSLSSRLEALRKLNNGGIQTWVSLAPIIPKMILTDMDSLMEELSRAHVSTVTLGVLRFIGYEESRMMFERKIGVRASEVIAGAEQVVNNIRELAHIRGIDTTGSLLEWKPEVDQKKMDAFWSPK